MIFTIFKKELLDTLRDRRTLLVMIIIPTLMFPLIFKLMTSFTNSIEEKSAAKTLIVGYIGEDNELIKNLKLPTKEIGKFEWKQFQDTSQINKAIRDDKIELGLFFENDFDQTIADNKNAKVTIIYDATDLGYKKRLEDRITAYNKIVSKQRLDSLKIDESLFSAIEIGASNVASNQEMLGKVAGGMIPYIFIIFGFLGCMYPAIDLFTGEKERGTVETLLTTPVLRWKILAGKMGVVVLSGLLASTFALGGLFFTTQNLLSGEKMHQITVVLDSVFSSQTIGMMFALVVPLIVFFAGLMIPITVYAKSFKEAQSIMTPLNLAMLLPAMIGMLPGIEYSIQTAFIPVVNVVLATKEIIAGTIDYTLFVGTFLSLILFAFLAVMFSHRQFGKETNISSNS